MDSDQLMDLLAWLKYMQENELTLEDIINGIEDGSLTRSLATSRNISE